MFILLYLEYYILTDNLTEPLHNCKIEIAL